MLEQGDRVLLGVSGGPDSVALLHLLYSRSALYNIQLFVVHVNHQLRLEAAEEAQYVQQLADQFGLDFRLFSVDVADFAAKNGLSFEQAGHEVRFACFQEAAEQWNITKLALGHHRDDRVESVLMHLIQGCGLDGLTAMPPKDGWLIRPLAEVSKRELVQYCQMQQLHYFVDATNLETGCLRNQIRLELLPQLQQYNPQIVLALLRLQDSCRAELDYLEQSTKALWEQYGHQKKDCVMFPAEILRQQHEALQRRLVRLLYQLLTGAEKNLTFQHTEQMRTMALRQEGSQQLSLPGNVIFLRQYHQLCLKWQEQEDIRHYCYKWNLRSPFFLEIWPSQFFADFLDHPVSVPADFYQVLVDADQLAETIEIRCRLPGDKIQPQGMQGHKKLKKFLIEKKIPVEERAKIPLFLSEEEIIWIPGYFLADRVKITNKTKRFCLLQCFRK